MELRQLRYAVAVADPPAFHQGGGIGPGGPARALAPDQAPGAGTRHRVVRALAQRGAPDRGGRDLSPAGSPRPGGDGCRARGDRRPQGPHQRTAGARRDAGARRAGPAPAARGVSRRLSRGSTCRCARTPPATCSRWPREARSTSRSPRSMLSGPQASRLPRWSASRCWWRCRPRTALAALETVDVRQLRHETFIFFKQGTGLRAVSERATERAGFVPAWVSDQQPRPPARARQRGPRGGVRARIRRERPASAGRRGASGVARPRPNRRRGVARRPPPHAGRRRLPGPAARARQT